MARFDQLLTNDAILAELGRRLRLARLRQNVTQEDLALEAGVGRLTVQRMERGDSVQVTTLVKVMRALGLLDGFEAALPESVQLPIEQLERERKRRSRSRARASREQDAPGDVPWRWGEEP
jgi:transcriptional regulator with XRE-family HTH domain